MWRALVLPGLAFGAACLGQQPVDAAAPMKATRIETARRRTVPHLPIIENAGQFPAGVAFAAIGSERTVVLGSTSMTVCLAGASCEIAFDGARAVTPRGESPTCAVVHAFRGTDGAAHPSHARTFGRVAYDEPWPGVSLRYDARPSGVEYSLDVAPHADAGASQFVVRGATDVAVTPDGELAVTTTAGVVTQSRPVAWQEIHGARVAVAAAFGLSPRRDDGTWTYGFALGDYDRSHPLTIDPELPTTYVPTGLSGTEQAMGLAADPAGNAYVCGVGMTPTAVPADKAAFDGTLGGTADAVVIKIGADDSIVWATFLGGDGNEYARGIAVDAYGAAVVVGLAVVAGYPVKDGPSTVLPGGGDVFVTRLAPDGASLLYSGFLGGTADDEARAVAVGADGAYVVGDTDPQGSASTRFFPVTTKVGTPNVARSYGWIAKVGVNGQRVYALDFRGGSYAQQYVLGVAVDGRGAAYATGITNGAGSLPPATWSTPYGGGDADAFVLKVNPAGNGFDYATYLGGDQAEFGIAVAADPKGNAFVVGITLSSTTSFPRRVDPKIDSDPGYGFLAKLDAHGFRDPIAYALPVATPSSLPVGEYGVAADAYGRVYVHVGNVLRFTNDLMSFETLAGHAPLGTLAMATPHDIWTIDQRIFMPSYNVWHSVDTSPLPDPLEPPGPPDDAQATIFVRVRHGRVVATTLPQRGGVSLAAAIDFAGGANSFDPQAEALRLAVGHSFTLDVPANDLGWRTTRKGALLWRGAVGAAGRATLRIDAVKGRLTLVARGVDVARPSGANPVATELDAGDDFGSDVRAWRFAARGSRTIARYR